MEFNVVLRNLNTPDAELLADLRRVARELKTDRLPVTSYLVHGRFCLTIVHRCFGRWTDAAKAAGLKPAIHRAKNHAELFENLQQVWRKLGKQAERRRGEEEMV